MKSSRDIELERLRLKILDAVRFSKRFWMTYRENTFGIASIINLIYKKSFFEVLFFTNSDVIEKGVPLLKIYTPLEDEIDFNEILFEPDFDEDGLINPTKIIHHMRRLISSEFQNHLRILNTEIILIDERFENYQIKANPYDREIIISYPDFTLKLKINLEKYPFLPTFSFSRSLSKIITEREFTEDEMIKNWDTENPPHIYELVDRICDIVSARVNIKVLKENSQYLVLYRVTLGDMIDTLSFKIQRGKSIGIIFDKKSLAKIDLRRDLMILFDAIAGSQYDFSGSIEIFGKLTQLLSQSEKEKIFILPQAYDSTITNMKIKKAIQYQINLYAIYKEKKEIFKLMLKKAGLAQGLDEIMEDFLKTRSYRINRKKAYLKRVLESTGLLNKKNKRFSKLTPIEFLLFSIAKALIQSPTIIMFSIPFGILGKLEYEKFNSYMDKIKEKFHVILIFHGPEEIISNCDQILTITKNTSKIGTIKEYIEELPQYGEILSIELNNPDASSILRLKEMKEIDVIIEERKNEKFKIYIKNSITDAIIQITELLGPSLYSFKRSTASISDYMEFVENR